MQIYDGSQVWDAGLTVEALVATDLVKELGPTLKRAHSFLKNSQVYIIMPLDLSNLSIKCQFQSALLTGYV